MMHENSEGKLSQGKIAALSCPLPLMDHATVQLAHGGGGRLMQQLIEGLFLPIFSRTEGAGHRAAVLHDSAVLNLSGCRLAFTTDSFVVQPLFFPGGDIGKLAVFGTVNDLAMAGAKPIALSASFILEEGFELDRLRQIVESMQKAAEEAEVVIVTGDTKVVDRGKGDGLFVTTAGIGLVPTGVNIRPDRVRPEDCVIVSGDLGRHGIAIMSVREGLSFECPLESDCAPLAGLVATLLEAGIPVHCMRDLTRGGLAAALNEIARHAQVGMELEEESIPVSAAVRGACELLGLDPLYVANEGRLVAFIPPEAASRAVECLRQHPLGKQAAIIGRCTAEQPGLVVARGPWGTDRIIDLLSGEQMPRIC